MRLSERIRRGIDPAWWAARDRIAQAEAERDLLAGALDDLLIAISQGSLSGDVVDRAAGALSVTTSRKEPSA